MHQTPPESPQVAVSSSSDVVRMFDRIARTYDLLNRVLSLGRDAVWRRRAVSCLDDEPASKLIDLATGTGDMLIALRRAKPGWGRVVGLDLSEEMLTICRRKLAARGIVAPVELVVGDAARTGFSGGCFDVATMGFGIRNTVDSLKTLQEIHRILKPGGRVVILEFSLPPNRLIRWAYLAYLRRVVPLVGGIVSGDHGAYRYLNRSIEGYFCPDRFRHLMQTAGFEDIELQLVGLGVACIYRGVKAGDLA